MKCSECVADIDAWLAKQHSKNEMADLPPRVSEHVVNCQACAVYLAVAVRIVGKGDFSDLDRYVVPQGLAKRTASRVLEAIGSDSERFVRPKRMLHRYLMIAAVLLVMIMPFLEVKDQEVLGDHNFVSESAQVELRLEAPHARSVVVVGDWNGWNVHADRLAKAGDGDMWSIEMNLERGKEYRYQFVIDGEQWIPDPHAYMQVDDGFGGKNSVLEM